MSISLYALLILAPPVRSEKAALLCEAGVVCIVLHTAPVPCAKIKRNECPHCILLGCGKNTRTGARGGIRTHTPVKSTGT